jgi:hypothetical protein
VLLEVLFELVKIYIVVLQDAVGITYALRIVLQLPDI